MERRMDRQRNYSRMLRSGNGAFYCAFVIVKLSGQFCVEPIYAHASRCVRYSSPRPEMARYVGPHNFAKIFVRRGGETEGSQDERCFQIRIVVPCRIYFIEKDIRYILVASQV